MGWIAYDALALSLCVSSIKTQSDFFFRTIFSVSLAHFDSVVFEQQTTTTATLKLFLYVCVYGIWIIKILI